jgi:predicted nucleotide-binding protein
MLDPFLPPGIIRFQGVSSAVRKLMGQAADVPYLFRLVALYCIDFRLQCYLDMLTSQGHPTFQRGPGMDEAELHLMREALVKDEKSAGSYRFRNAIISCIFRCLFDLRLNRDLKTPIDRRLSDMAQRISSWHEVKNEDEWISTVRSAWAFFLGMPESIKVAFLYALENQAIEPWVVVEPNARCWLKRLSGAPVLYAEVVLRNGWSITAEIILGRAHELNEESRYLVECWLAYLRQGADLAVTFHLATIGEKNVLRNQNRSPLQKRSIFIVHGRDDARRRAMHEFLLALNLDPIDWNIAKRFANKTPPTIFEIIDAGMHNAQACIVLMTGDDEARLRKPFISKSDGIEEEMLTPQARANVIFEAGMALGRYPERTILVQFGIVRRFSDVGGFDIVQYHDELSFREKLISSLQFAGCPIDSTNDKWKNTASFSTE